jgi:putative transposase
MCSALEVSPRGFYSWQGRSPSPRRQFDRRLLAEIRASFTQSGQTYGSPRVWKDLRELDYRCGRKRVARIMRENGLAAVLKRRYKLTTQSGHNLPVMENLLKREFRAAEANRIWLADITYIQTEEGWLYLAALLDLYSRRVVGWHTSDRIDRYLPLAALNRALRRRQPKPGLIHHSHPACPTSKQNAHPNRTSERGS